MVVGGYIDRQMIVDQIAATEAQRQSALRTIEQCNGVLELCHAWLKKIDEELKALEAKAELARAVAKEAANMN